MTAKVIPLRTVAVAVQGAANCSDPLAKEGKVYGATVIGVHGGAFTVELDTSETAMLPIGMVLGTSQRERVDRFADLTGLLHRDSKIYVRVVVIYPGRDFQRKITVREVRENGTFSRSPRKRRHNQRPEPYRFGIRTWRA